MPGHDEPYERPTASVEQQVAPTLNYYEPPVQPEAPAPVEESVEESPALPQGLAEILKDEAEPAAAELPQPEATPPPAPPPSPVAPPATTQAQSPAQPGSQRQEPVRTPTSSLVGRFWSRIGKSQR